MTAADDVVIAGGGPAGCVAAVVLARAGVRVRILDRACFPRNKLCGDTVNPGTLAVLRQLGLRAAETGLPIAGMIVTGPGGVHAPVRYPIGVVGRALTRCDLDFALLQEASRAGAAIEEDVLVQGPVLHSRDRRVCGVQAGRRRGTSTRQARVVIAADGRGSRLARCLSLARHPARPRRWAIGAYYVNVAGLTDMGEMHVRAGHYIGVAPLPSGIANACIVTADRARLRSPESCLDEILRTDPDLSSRFRTAERISRPAVLGPLAVECRGAGVPGLLLAGDAAGFVDPMTGDGLRFAVRGGILAAEVALRMLETGESNGHERLEAARRREFGGKWRFNRTIRRLVDSPAALTCATVATRLSTWPLGPVVRYAGDLDVDRGIAHRR